MRVLSADACVVGAGAGGAVVAAELAEGGCSVVVLEQGAEPQPHSFTARPPEMLARLYHQAGQTLTIGNPPIALPLGRGLGGTTLINSGTCFRTPPQILDRWRHEAGLEISESLMEPYFHRVEKAISVAPVTPELAGRNAAVIREGAERLGWSHGYLHRNARGCVGSGVCVFGCPTGAKQHTGITYIPRARAAGARIITEATVQRVETRFGRARGVSARLSGGEELRVNAPIVVIAAGTVATPALLARSGLGGGSGQLGRNLSLHPATAALARMDQLVDMAQGVPQSLYVDEFAPDGIMFEGVAGPPAYVAMSLPLLGERHREVMSDYRHLAQFGLMISDSSRGRVHSLGGRPMIRYSLDDADLHRIRRGLFHLEELMLAAGAREVFLPLARGVRPPAARRRDLRLMAFHPLGTARAHADPRRGVLDGDLQLHDAPGVFVADGSAVPSSLGVNPQLTIMALATRLALSRLLEAGAGARQLTPA